MSVVLKGRAQPTRAAALANLLAAARAVAARLLLAFGLAVSAVGYAQDGGDVLGRVQALEAESMSVLHGHHAFEASLMSPDSDRLTVFLTLPHGARVILNEATLYIDGKKVFNHFFSVAELQALRDRASLIFFATRIPPGEHSVRLDVTAMQGNILPMKAYPFVKSRSAKFIEIQIAGYEVRQPFAADW